MDHDRGGSLDTDVWEYSDGWNHGMNSEEWEGLKLVLCPGDNPQFKGKRVAGARSQQLCHPNRWLKINSEGELGNNPGCVQTAIWGFCNDERDCTGPHKIPSPFWIEKWREMFGKKRSNSLRNRHNQPQDKRKFSNSNSSNQSTGWGENNDPKRQANFSAMQESLTSV
jgi:hypothetical protein